MPYRILDDEPVPVALRRIAREQIDRALAEAADDELGVHETVHQVRKRCKKLRGLLRLVRPANEDLYQRENVWFRDTARELSDLRDAEALLEAWDMLADHDEVDDDALASGVREQLAERRRELAWDEMDAEKRLDHAVERLREGRQRVDEWDLDAVGWDAIGPGVKKSYRRGSKRYREALETPSTHVLHEWRKRVKYHRYHCKLLRNLWWDPMEARRSEVHLLSDLLGDDHDLAVLDETLRREERFGDAGELEGTHEAIAARRGRLQSESLRLGRRVVAEKPKHLVRRWKGYWEAFAG